LQAFRSIRPVLGAALKSGVPVADDRVTLVKQANDIVEVIGEYLTLRKQGRVYKGLCPFHDDHNPSMTVDATRQNFKCWACGKSGDVLSFVQERERVDFVEALHLLARRANIPLKRGDGARSQQRLQMLDLMKWAEEQFHKFLLEAPGAESARKYLAERSLSDETIRKYGLGFAPEAWEWLSQRARKAGWSAEMLVAVGLCAPRESDNSLYDRFRDRVIFPIRDVRGRTVGFGGRILPGAAATAPAPKYYNSTDTPLFTKSEHLYGLDQARAAGEAAGYLAVVEGYTDVLMAHQKGVLPVVATLGTALNVRHIAQLRRYTPRVVLVFDADAGGDSGVDRALELFISQDVDLAIATLPEGLDPCDLLAQRGPEAFSNVLDQAVNALDFKLTRAFTPERRDSVEGKRRAMEEVLSVLALTPALAGPAGQLKRELLVTRIAQRAGVKEETVWKRLHELRPAQRAAGDRTEQANAEEPQQARASRVERELLGVLLAEPELTARAQEEVETQDIIHPGLQRMLQEIYALATAGESPSADRVRAKLADNTRLSEYVLVLRDHGLSVPQRDVLLEECLAAFRRKRLAAEVDELQGQLNGLPTGGPPPVELLKQLQEKR
jgi:DNA primase